MPPLAWLQTALLDDSSPVNRRPSDTSALALSTEDHPRSLRPDLRLAVAGEVAEGSSSRPGHSPTNYNYPEIVNYQVRLALRSHCVSLFFPPARCRDHVHSVDAACLGTSSREDCGSLRAPSPCIGERTRRDREGEMWTTRQGLLSF